MSSSAYKPTTVQHGKYIRPSNRIETPIQMPEANMEVLLRVVKQLKEAVERLQERVHLLEGGGIYKTPTSAGDDG